MVAHVSIPNSLCHEPKHITDATTADSGKVITPDASTDGVSELRLLALADLSDSSTVALVASTVATNGDLPVYTYKLDIAAGDLGSDQATAYEMVNHLNKITTGQITAATADTVKLPDGSSYAAGTTITLCNDDGTTAAQVYPPSGGNLDGAGVDTAVAQATTTTYHYVLVTPASNIWTSVRVS